MKRINMRISADNKKWRKVGLAGWLLCCAVGCQSLFHRKEATALHDPFSREAQTASIDNVKGPMERVLQTGHHSDMVNPNSLRAEDVQDFSEFNAAKRLLEEGNLAAAEQKFKKIADDHKLDDSGFIRKRRWKDLFKARSELKASYSDSPLREDSLFMLAETQYKQDELPAAETNYLLLLKEFPNTRHMDASTKRLFDIAMIWMDFKVAKSSDVQLAAYSDNGRASRPKVVSGKDYKKHSFFNFTNKKRPLTDTEGRALEALKAIWLNDPTGKLADDALMFTASHQLRTGRYSEAAETYRLLREEFPQSPHAKDAYVLGAYVSQASYQGASYDGKSLTESRQLQLMAMNLFPDATVEEKKRLQQGLQDIEDKTVARNFNRAIFWLRKGRFEAVEMTCYHIINTYPNSKYVGKARGLLAKLPEYRKKNPLVLALEGVDADSIESLDELPPPSPMQTPSAPPKIQSLTPDKSENNQQAPKKEGGFRMPRLKPIPVPNLLPRWSKDPKEEFVPKPIPTSPQEDTSEPGRVKLTLGGE